MSKFSFSKRSLNNLVGVNDDIAPIHDISITVSVGKREEE